MSHWFTREVPKELQTIMNATPWKYLRPGIWQKEINYCGLVLRARRMDCQDCRDETAMMTAPILKDALWRRLYPERGVACGECIVKRLGRPLRKSDLKETAKGNYGFMQDLEP